LNAPTREAAVRTIARDGDPDRYLSALFAPAAARDHLLALYAFNVELARVGELVHEPQLGEIRLQWWRDVLACTCDGEVAGHPVADTLAIAVRKCQLSRQSLSDLIDARRFDLSVKIMSDTLALDDYLGETAGALFRLAAEITSSGTLRQESGVLEPAIRAAGIAYGLTGLMRALPVHAARGRVDVPEDALFRHGTSPAQILAGQTSKGLRDVLAELRETARVALGSAERQVATLPPAAQRAFLPLALVEPYLSALRRVDPLKQVAEINPLYRLWRVSTYRFRQSA